MNGGRGRARLQKEIKRKISAIVEFEARDPELKSAFPTVMDVKLSADVRYAKVYVAFGGTNVDTSAVMAALRRDRGFIRTELARRLSVRYTPELEFIHDETIERAMHVERLLQEEEDEIEPN